MAVDLDGGGHRGVPEQSAHHLHLVKSEGGGVLGAASDAGQPARVRDVPTPRCTLRPTRSVKARSTLDVLVTTLLSILSRS